MLGLMVSQDSPFLPAEFETERLILKIYDQSDAQDVYGAWATDVEASRFLTWRPQTSIEQTLERAIIVRNEYVSEKSATYLARLKDDSSLVAGLSVRPDGHMSNLGYVVNRRLWGQGFGTEICRAGILLSLALPKVERVWAVADVENTASSKVLEKAGMTFEGILRRWGMHPNISSSPRDVRCFSILREEVTGR